MRTIFLIIALFICSCKASAQDVVSSTVNIESCVDNMQCVTSNNSGLLFYDDSKNALYFKVDFYNEEDSVIEWLKDLPENNLYLKVVVPPDFFTNTPNFNQKNIPLNGLIFFNGVWKPQKIEIGLLSGERSNLVIDRITDPYEKFKVNFMLSVLPDDFLLVDAGQGKIRETISVSLTSGRVNQLKPGMEALLGKAYNHE